MVKQMPQASTDETIELAENILKSAREILNVTHMVKETPMGSYIFDIGDQVTSKRMLVLGGVDTNVTNRCMEMITPEMSDGILLDIGSNIGTFSIPLALENKFRQIHAFEPAPRNFDLLSQNIARNHVEGKVIPHPYAIGNANTRLPFELSPENFGDHRVRFEPAREGLLGETGRHTIEVECFSMNNVLEKEAIDLENVKMIKADTQGAEGQIMKGASKIFEKKIPWIIELWPYGLSRAGTTKQEILDILFRNFVSFFRLEANNWYEEHKIFEIEQTFDRLNTGFCDILLLP
jgi:FkbM family methyltransferase